MPVNPYMTQFDPSTLAMLDPSAITGDSDQTLSTGGIIPRANPYPKGANGFQKLGFLLTPGGRQAVRDYGAAMRNRAGVNAALEELRAEKLKNDVSLGNGEVGARNNLSAYLQTKYGMNPQIADATAGITLASGDFSKAGAYMGDVQKQGLQSQAAQDFAAGNTQAGNQSIAAGTGKFYQPIKITDGVAFDPNNAASDFRVTPVGQSDINQHNAAAAHSQAAAHAINTKLPLQLDNLKNGTPTRKQGAKALALTTATAKLLGDLDPTGALNPKGTQDAAILAANPNPGTMAAIQARQPMTTDPLQEPGMFSAGNLGSNFYAGQGEPPYIVPNAPVSAAADLGLAPKSAPAKGVATPTTQADFNALPSGALFVNPKDGKTYRKK